MKPFKLASSITALSALRFTLLTCLGLTSLLAYSNQNLQRFNGISQSFCNTTTNAGAQSECQNGGTTSSGYLNQITPLEVLSFNGLLLQQNREQLHNINQYLRDRRKTQLLEKRLIGEKNSFSERKYGLGLFFSGNDTSGEQSATQYEFAYDSAASSLTSGIDYQISPEWYAGIALGQSDSELDYRPNTVENHTETISFYSSWYRRSFAVDTLLGFSRSDLDMQRQLADSAKAQSSTTTDSLFIHLSGSFDFVNDNWVYGPMSAIRYQSGNVDDVTETGNSVWNGSYQFEQTTSSIFMMGGHLAYSIPFRWGAVVPYFRAEWQTELADDPDPVTGHLNLQSDQSFSLQTTPYDSSWFLISTGISITLLQRISAYMDYDEILDYEHRQHRSINLGANWQF